MLQASQQEAGRDEQDQRERHLNDDERTAGELMAARDAHRMLWGAAGDAGIEAVACGQQADEQADQRRQAGGECQDRPVDGDGAGAW